MMPALPGTYLVRVHARFPFAALKAGFNACSRCDDARQFSQRWFLQFSVGHTRRGQVVAITIVGILIAGIRRSVPLHRALLREGMTRDDQPLFGPRAFAFQTRLHAACDYLDLHGAFLLVS